MVKMDYGQAKIYVIKSNRTDKVYIGGTSRRLELMFAEIRGKYKYCKTSKFADILKYEETYIELIEEYACSNKTELDKRVDELIQSTPNAVNKDVQKVKHHVKHRSM